MFKNETWNIIFLIFLLMLYCCDTKDCNPFGAEPNGPVEPKWVEVEVKYQRVNDNPNCPRIYFGLDSDQSVYLQGMGGLDRQMEEIEKNLFYKNIPKVGVNYPYAEYGYESRKIYVLDHVFSAEEDTGCEYRAHNMWFNGYSVPKDRIHKIGNKEHLLVRFDENGVPYFE